MYPVRLSPARSQSPTCPPPRRGRRGGVVFVHNYIEPLGGIIGFIIFTFCLLVATPEWPTQWPNAHALTQAHSLTHSQAGIITSAPQYLGQFCAFRNRQATTHTNTGPLLWSTSYNNWSHLTQAQSSFRKRCNSYSKPASKLVRCAKAHLTSLLAGLLGGGRGSGAGRG